MDVAIYSWIPHPEVRAHFPLGHKLDFWCICDTDGIRQFVPELALRIGWGGFLVNASCGGMAILEQRWRGASAEVRSNNCNHYRLRQLIYQWSFNDKRSLNREFTRLEDLTLRPNERPDPSISTIIPEWAFWNSHDVRQDPRSQNEQMELFRQAAQAEVERCGRTSATEVELISFGIVGLARRDPLNVNCSTNELVLTKIRKSVWEEYDPKLEFSSDIKNEIEDRLWEALRKHIELPNEEFHRWFFDDVDNLVTQISKRKRNGRVISRKQVNRAFGELVWEAYLSTSELVAEQFRMFEGVLPDRLSEKERELFNAFFRPQRHFGGLIPLLLYPRFKLLKPTLIESISNNSDNSLAPAIITSILIYAEMVKAKRDAETRAKKSTRSDRTSHRASAPTHADPVDIDFDRQENDDQ
jgi:hypothetical protein